MMLMVFGLLLVMLGGSIAFISRQFRDTVNQEQGEQAFYAAEAGVQYTLFLLNSGVYSISQLVELGSLEHNVNDDQTDSRVGIATIQFYAGSETDTMRVISFGSDNAGKYCQAIIVDIRRGQVGNAQPFIITAWDHYLSCQLIATPVPTPSSSTTPTPSASVTPTPSSSATPTPTPGIIFSDTFSGVNGTELINHSPDVGLGWTKVIEVGTGGGQIIICGDGTAGGFGACDGDPAESSQGTLYTANASGYGVNYEVSVTAVGVDTTDDASIIAIRAQDANNMYAVRFSADVSSGQFYKKVGGIWTALGAAFNGPASGSQVKLVASNNTLSFHDDGAPVRIITDASIEAPGKAALGIGAAVLSADDANDQRFDNFQVNIL